MGNGAAGIPTEVVLLHVYSLVPRTGAFAEATSSSLPPILIGYLWILFLLLSSPERLTARRFKVGPIMLLRLETILERSMHEGTVCDFKKKNFFSSILVDG